MTFLIENRDLVMKFNLFIRQVYTMNIPRLPYSLTALLKKFMVMRNATMIENTTNF